MGWQLAGEAFRADLSPNLRSVLVILCDVCAMDDPDKSYASVSYIAYESGYSVRQVQYLLRCLETRKYISCLTRGRGRGHTNHYRIHIERIPMRPKWRDMRARLIELGEIEDDRASVRDVHAAVRRVKRQRQAEEQERESAE